MPINIKQFARGSLGVALTATDTLIQLTQGGGAVFAIPVGDFGYITLYDGLSVEVVRYGGATLFTDIITVTRAQDGTAAGAFPVGTCVAVTPNLKNILEYVRANINNPSV